MNVEIGNKVKIICNFSNHIFQIGEIVEVKIIGEFMGEIYAYFVCRLNNEDWQGVVYKGEIENIK